MFNTYIRLCVYCQAEHRLSCCSTLPEIAMYLLKALQYICFSCLLFLSIGALCILRLANSTFLENVFYHITPMRADLLSKAKRRINKNEKTSTYELGTLTYLSLFYYRKKIAFYLQILLSCDMH